MTYDPTLPVEDVQYGTRMRGDYVETYRDSRVHPSGAWTDGGQDLYEFGEWLSDQMTEGLEAPRVVFRRDSIVQDGIVSVVGWLPATEEQLRWRDERRRGREHAEALLVARQAKSRHKQYLELKAEFEPSGPDGSVPE